MPIKIKPIETIYKDVHFRSRLEVRWALFFDKLGIEWEYEPEGFRLSGGINYLPDFWLPGFDDGGVYAEVKPADYDPTKNIAFVLSTGKRLWLCRGVPDFKTTQLLVKDSRGNAIEYFTVIPNADQAEGENRFFAEPGYDGGDGRFDPAYAGETFSDAVVAVRGHRFWNPRPVK